MSLFGFWLDIYELIMWKLCCLHTRDVFIGEMLMSYM